MRNKTKEMVSASLLAALVCVATMMIKIPSPLKGYLNLGDCAVLISGWLLSPAYAFLAAGIGSALADIFSGYVIYAPATFLIKGLMALMAGYGFMILHKKLGEIPSRIIGGAAVEFLMVVGYLLFESILYGFGAAALNILANAIQGIAGLGLGMMLIKILRTYVKPSELKTWK